MPTIPSTQQCASAGQTACILQHPGVAPPNAMSKTLPYPSFTCHHLNLRCHTAIYSADYDVQLARAKMPSYCTRLSLYIATSRCICGSLQKNRGVCQSPGETNLSLSMSEFLRINPRLVENQADQRRSVNVFDFLKLGPFDI